ncbi:MAG: nitrogenase molybdenum-iron protein [Clostridia bacterium]|nr:nitrogenase molybdenum-iron protein [Clostridia bacterium]
MKGLYRYLSPFSPDQSGAVAVLYELGGLIVILDAGGCAGNICGFDEPRWGHKQSAVYSAGIRDLDAILGRDERTVNKIGDAVEAVGDARFIALIGTPVPAVVGTDLRALARMCEKKFGLPTLAVETYGMEYYDKGADLAYMTLIKALENGQFDRVFEAQGLPKPSEFCAKLREDPPERDWFDVHTVGVLGATPLDLLGLDGAELQRKRIAEVYTGAAVRTFGMDSDLFGLLTLFTADRHVVIAPSGLKAARYLEQRYGIPFEAEYRIGNEVLGGIYRAVTDIMLPSEANVLILHQQLVGNGLRDILPFHCTVGTFFELDAELAEPQDVRFTGEDEFLEFIQNGNFNVILGDPMYRMALKQWKGLFLPLPQYAVSGEAHELREEKLLRFGLS